MDVAENRGRKIIEIPIEGSPYRIVEMNGYRSLMAKGNDISTHSEILLAAPDALVLPYAPVMLHALPFSRRLDDILLIGLGGGNLTKFLYRYLPSTRLVAVEIDPIIVDVAHTYFNLPPDDERLSVVVGDGRHYIETHPHCCDVLVCDGYDQTFNVPDSLAGEDFYLACHRALRPGGVVSINLDRRSDAWRAAHLCMLGRIFPAHMEIPVLDSQSVLLLFKEIPAESYAVRMQRAQNLEASMELGLLASIDRYEHMRHQANMLGQ